MGGTSLLFDSEGLAAETALSDGGGGCSAYENPNPAQRTGSINCAGNRATPDISVDADPNSGVAVYDSVPYKGSSGWWTVGGTSLSTVVIAAESDASGTGLNASAVYGGKVDVRDVVSGSNGYPALVGYDLATGVGSWSNTPGTITSLSAVGGSGEVNLSWSAPTGGAPVSGYNIWIGTSAGGESLAATGIAATNYSDFPVAPGAVFYFEVQPVNALGVGPLSNEVDASASGPAPTCQSDSLEWCLSPVSNTTTSFTVSGAYPETGDDYDPMSGYRLDWSLCATSGVECYEPGYSCGDTITWQGDVTSGTMTASDLTPGDVYCVFAENLADDDLTGGLVVSLPSA